MKPGIVAMVPDAWGGPWMPRHQIMTRLCAYAPVVWLDQVDAWQHHLLHPNADPRAIAGNQQLPESSNFIFYRPNRLLGEYYRPAWLRDLARRRRVAAAVGKLRALGCDQLVLYMWRPEFGPAMFDQPWSLVLYHIDDEYSFEETHHAVPEAERLVIQAADQIIVHSAGLMESKGGLNGRTALIPNGVDFQRFSTPAAEPADLAPIPHPRIGYVGVIKKQLDLELIADLATRSPDKSFVMVGPVFHETTLAPVLGRLQALPNVHLLGAKAVADLPGYVQHLDVGLLCYRVNAYTNNIFPLKLHEYFAAGLPTVAAPIRTLQHFSSHLLLASTAPEWMAAIEQALEQDAPEYRAARQALARQYDWDKLTEDVWSLIRKGLERNQGSPAGRRAMRDRPSFQQAARVCLPAGLRRSTPGSAADSKP